MFGKFGALSYFIRLLFIFYISNQIAGAFMGSDSWAESLIKLINRFKTKKEEVQTDRKYSFDDVIGIEEYKDEVIDIVRYLKDPAPYKRMGAEVPRGILLTGPPGTGKTLLAKALASEAGCKFIYVAGSDVDKLFVG